MIAGVSGSLIGGGFLESKLAGSDAPPSAIAAIASALRDAAAVCGPASSTRALLQSGAIPLVSSLGFDAPTNLIETAGAMVATIADAAGAVALVVAPFGSRLDPCWRTAVLAARQRNAGWAVLYNGVALRLVDASRLHARRHLEFDLDLAAHPAGLQALWLTLAASALDTDHASTRTLVAASDEHASDVCRSLRDGVLSASAGLLGALLAGRNGRRAPPIHESFEQALTIVYRLLFLLFAEARALVPLWHPVYRESYSVDALRAASERSEHTPGLWDAVRAMARLAHAGCRAGDLQVTPFNGRLFSPARTPLAERGDLDDGQARRAVLALSTRPNGPRGARERITYRDLGVEQLGAVYETLLDYEPHAAGPGAIELRAESGVRKATGTFYTPQPIADYLVRHTLGPLVHGLAPDQILQLRVVDPSMGSGAFLVAACRYLADAYETAAIAAGEVEPHDFGEAERAILRRRVAERCLYGIDVNPMAVQLARLSLWLATLAADRPLSFLDHRLMTGDSLVGAWLADLRARPQRRRTRLGLEPTLFDGEAVGDALRKTLPVRFSLEVVPSDTIAQVRAKEHAHAAAGDRSAALWGWKQIADAWCASWFHGAVPAAAFGALTDFFLHGSASLPRQSIDRYASAAADAARANAFFHWELECPEVFFDSNGARRTNPGFDAVIGNPPWNVVHADSSALLRFVRDAGVYRASGEGHANRYQLFVERAVTLTRRGGRIGLVLPWGFAADHGSAALRRFVVDRTAMDAIVAIDNRRGVFPIHRSVRFALVSATAGAATDGIACRLGVEDPAALESLDDDQGHPTASIRLSPAMLERLSGPALAVPYVRTPVDLAIAERSAALFRPLSSPVGWGATFGRELNATDDRALFRSAGRGWPVVDGKHLSPFRVDLGASERTIAPADARRALGAERCDRTRLAYRDVASATNRVTLIAALLPPQCVSTHTLFCLKTPLALRNQRLLCGLFNSLVVNFLVRLRVTTHVTTAIVEMLPLPLRSDAPTAADEIAALARLLARRPDESAFARLNALVARLYQLTEAEFEHVLETFPLVEISERTRVMAMFRTMTRRS